MSLNGKLASTVVLYPDPVLQREAISVIETDLATWSSSVAPLVQSMIGLMLSRGGVGMAAPQVGISRRLLVAKLSTGAVAMANPVVTVTDEAMEQDIEGCLSIPSLQASVPRPRGIKVMAMTTAGSVEFDLTGLDARIVLHEVDHLDGILFPQRLSNIERASLLGHINDMRKRARS